MLTNEVKQPKRLNIININTESSTFHLCKLFKKPKRVIKTLQINSNHSDNNPEKIEFREWIRKMNDSKSIRSQMKSTIKPGRMLTIYNAIQDDERDKAKSQSFFKNSEKLNATDPLKLNRKRAQHNGWISQKTILCQKQFFTDMNEHPSTTFGFLPTQSRFGSEFISKKRPFTSSKIRQRCSSERKQLFTFKQYQKYLEESQSTRLHISKEENRFYSRKSKRNKIWETMGLNEWKNVI